MSEKNKNEEMNYSNTILKEKNDVESADRPFIKIVVIKLMSTE